MTQTIHCCSRSPRRSRTHSGARLLFTTHHSIPLLFPSPVLCKAARRQPRRANIPATSLTTQHPSACPSLCFTLRCAINSKTRREPGVETAHRLCGRLKSISESCCGKGTRWSLANIAALLERTLASALRDSCAVGSLLNARADHFAGVCPPERRGLRQTLLIFLSFAPLRALPWT